MLPSRTRIIWNTESRFKEGDDVKAGLERTCRMVAVASWSQVSGGAGRMVQFASLCCKQSRTSSVICSTLHGKNFVASGSNACA